MSALPRHTCACTTLLTILILGGWSAMGYAGDVPRSTTPSPTEPSDSRRAEPADLERLIPDSAFNTEASTELMVEDNPILTDRGFVHIPASAFSPASLDLLTFAPYAYTYDGFAASVSSTICAPVIAAVHLPEGVAVGLVALTAIDDSREDLELRLQRLPALVDLDAIEMAFIQTDNFNPGVGIWLDDSINEPVIQNGFYQYQLTSCVTAAMMIRSVFIYYTP